MQGWGRPLGPARAPAGPDPGALSKAQGPSLHELLQSPLPTWEGLSSLKGPTPSPSPLPNPSHLKTGGSLHCPSSSLGPTPSAPNFPGLGWEEIQSSLWDDITQRPACRVVSHLDTCSQLTTAWAALGGQHPQRQMPERAGWEPACARGGEGRQEDTASLCVSVCLSPSLWSSLQ